MSGGEYNSQLETFYDGQITLQTVLIIVNNLVVAKELGCWLQFKMRQLKNGTLRMAKLLSFLFMKCLMQDTERSCK